jgi:hypothetical protein
MLARRILTPAEDTLAAEAIASARFYPCTSQDMRLVWAILCGLSSMVPQAAQAHRVKPVPSDMQETEIQKADGADAKDAKSAKKGAPVKPDTAPGPVPDGLPGGARVDAPVDQAAEVEAPPIDEEPASLETVEILGRETDLIGVTASASQGVVGQNQFKYRPLMRVGELVEVVPGMMATQHSGSGKANQYFLRGFNLDHGTDFATWVDGVPMNLPSNAHGQGYMDLNSIIPELIDRVEYGKGPYYAELGDFAAAGYANMHTLHRLPEGFVKFTGGKYDFYRAVAADSTRIGPGDLLFGAALNFYDGPWEQPMDLNQFNGLLRYTIDEKDWGLSFVGVGYNAKWIATNQIPQALVKTGELDLYGTMNPTDGGNTNRYSAAANIWSRGDGYRNEANLYAVYYDLDLYSDFTFFLNYPVQGDQILQKEHRMIYGGSASQTWFNKLFGTEMDNSVGIQVRNDRIGGLELANTEFRDVFSITSVNSVVQTSVGVYLKSENRWTDWFRSIAGVREDIYNFNVHSELTPANRGERAASLMSPKVSLIFGPWADTELYVNGGYGFHSNDARGTTARISPVSGDPTHPVTPLARARGAEVGARTQYLEGLTSTFALWFLESDSALVFVGDEGTTEPTGPGQRYGLEWANYYQPTDWLMLDADFAFTKSRYTDVPAAEDRIPNSVGQVITSGATVQMPYGFWSTVRLRHFSNVPLNETGTAYMGSTTLVNLGFGWQRENLKLSLDLFNMFDSKANDIAYYYQYRLPNQPPEGVEGKLIHPVEPRMLRGTISISF